MIDFVFISITVGCILVILGSGQYVLTRLCGQLSLMVIPYSLISVMLFTYLISGRLLTIKGRSLSFVVAFLITFIAMIIFSSIHTLITVRFRGANALIVSLLTYIFLYGFTTQFLSLMELVQGVNANTKLMIGNIDLLDMPAIGSMDSRASSLIYISLALTFLVVMFTFNVTRSSLSRKMSAVASDIKTLGCFDVSPSSLILQANIFTAMTATIAGVLIAYQLKSLPGIVSSMWLNTQYLALIQLALLAVVIAKKSYGLTIIFIMIFVGGSVFIAQYVVENVKLFSDVAGHLLISSLTMMLLSTIVIGTLYLRSRQAKKAL